MKWLATGQAGRRTGHLRAIHSGVGKSLLVNKRKVGTVKHCKRVKICREAKRETWVDTKDFPAVVHVENTYSKTSSFLHSLLPRGPLWSVRLRCKFAVWIL